LIHDVGARNAHMRAGRFDRGHAMQARLYMILGTLMLFCPSIALAADLGPFRSVPVPEHKPQTSAKIEIGKMLFFDRRLWGDGTMS